MTDVTVWDGSTDDDWTDATNWSNGVPSSSKIASIPASLSTYPDLASDCTVHALELASGATLTGGTNITVYVTGESAGETNAPPDGYAVNLDGTISGELSFNLTTPATTLMDLVPSSGNVHNLTINHSSFIGTFLGDTSIAGNLTITAGELKSAGSNSLTVTGDCIVEGTLTGNASAISIGSLRVDGTYSATSGTTIITSERSNGRAIDIVGTYTHNSGTLEIRTPADTDLRYPSSSSLNNLTINHASCIARPTGNNKPPIGGNLTITAGTFNTLDSDGSSNHALTVTGDASVTGTLTGNASAISLGSLTIPSGGTYSATSGTTTITSESSLGYAANVDGTFTHNNGTLTITTPASTFMSPITPYNLIINHSSANVRFTGPSASTMTIANDLTITAGIFDPDDGDENLTVTGDVSVTGTLGASNVTSAMSFGSLEIQSGGEYIATSGTTTITTGGTIAGTTNMAFGGEGTFTHNNGTLVLDSTLHRIPRGGTFYNLTLNGEQSTDGIYGYTTTMLPQAVMPDGTTDANYMSILGTLQINNDEFRPYNTDKIYVHNLIIGDGTGSANSAKFDMSEADTFDGTVFVDNVTINSDGQLLFGDGDETSSTVGSSALNIYGAFRNLGGNVTIE